MRSDRVRRTGRVPLRCLAATLVFAGLLQGIGAAGSLAAGAAEGAATAAITALAVNSQDGTLWIGTGRGLLRSADQARTVTSVALPTKVPATEITAVAMEFRSPWSVYAAAAGEGMFKSEDGGKSWAAVNSGLADPDIRGLALSPKDGRLHAHVRGNGLFVSKDGARSWKRAAGMSGGLASGPAGTISALASVNMSNGMGGIFLYAATDQGLARSPD